MNKKAILPLVFVLLACLRASAGENPAFVDYRAFLAANPVGVMTTVDGQQPRTRAFQFLWADGDKIYFSTGSYKDVYAQLQANGRASFCTHTPDYGVVLSVDGKVVFVDDVALKDKALDGNPGIKGIYKSGSNPEFVLFHIEAETIYTYSFAGGKQYIKQ